MRHPMYRVADWRAGQERCLRTAYADAGVSPDTIELVEAHGTGTKVGDATEAAALTEVFSRDAERSALASTRSAPRRG